MRPNPDTAVDDWVDRQPGDQLFITATTVSEIVQGVMSMPDGIRKREIDDAGTKAVGAFYQRTLAFDAAAGVEYGRLCADRRAAGRPISRADAEIAAICLVYGAALATRNGKDFVALGIELIDPWRSG